MRRGMGRMHAPHAKSDARSSACGCEPWCATHRASWLEKCTFAAWQWRGYCNGCPTCEALLPTALPSWSLPPRGDPLRINSDFDLNVELESTHCTLARADIHAIRTRLQGRRYRTQPSIAVLENKLLAAALLRFMDIPISRVLYGAFATHAWGPWPKYEPHALEAAVARTSKNFVLKPASSGGAIDVLVMTAAKWAREAWTPARVRDFAEGFLRRRWFSAWGLHHEYVGIVLQELLEPDVGRVAHHLNDLRPRTTPLDVAGWPASRSLEDDGRGGRAGREGQRRAARDERRQEARERRTASFPDPRQRMLEVKAHVRQAGSSRRAIAGLAAAVLAAQRIGGSSRVARVACAETCRWRSAICRPRGSSTCRRAIGSAGRYARTHRNPSGPQRC